MGVIKTIFELCLSLLYRGIAVTSVGLLIEVVPLLQWPNCTEYCTVGEKIGEISFMPKLSMPKSGKLVFLVPHVLLSGPFGVRGENAITEAAGNRDSEARTKDTFTPDGAH